MNILNGMRRQSVFERDHVRSMFNKYGIYDGVNKRDAVPEIVQKVKNKYANKLNRSRRSLFQESVRKSENNDSSKPASYTDKVRKNT